MTSNIVQSSQPPVKSPLFDSPLSSNRAIVTVCLPATPSASFVHLAWSGIARKGATLVPGIFTVFFISLLVAVLPCIVVLQVRIIREFVRVHADQLFFFIVAQTYYVCCVSRVQWCWMYLGSFYWEGIEFMVRKVDGTLLASRADLIAAEIVAVFIRNCWRIRASISPTSRFNRPRGLAVLLSPAPFSPD
jgi:hypothetical protein